MSIDSNLEFYDFAKLENSKLVQRCFIVLDRFKIKYKKMPEPWNSNDAGLFVAIYQELFKDELTPQQMQFIQEFAFVSKGYLPPLCAFFGGLASQEIIKGITQKYKPINSSIYI